MAVINRIRPIHVAFSVPEKYLPALQTALRDGDKKMVAGILFPARAKRWKAKSGLSITGLMPLPQLRLTGGARVTRVDVAKKPGVDVAKKSG
ncbi:MAG: hypothetical protein IPO13_13280 [Rhodocyclaceae bacterium]|nr:hypothetical protein [Rhodocyclaceae bacterium]